ncbi:MAG: hypothetical protein ACYS0I_01165 [Planctomycetota bacterium]|jgi:flagellar basal body rod protein FlgB
MNLTPLITDNITELLVKIIEFTQTRQKILAINIKNIHAPGFIPKDLAVEEFSNLLNNAINEHIKNQRLVLCDTENIKFGFNGNFEAIAIDDDYAIDLLQENKDEYLQLQINKLLENLINQRITAELLRQKQEGAV